MDSERFERLFEDSFDSLYGYLARRVGPELARDLAAETFASRRRFDFERGEARAWLFGIAQNLLRRHYRDEERRLRLLARLDPPAHLAAYPEESHIASALTALSVEERDVLLLFAWADLSYQEIATALRVPVGTVRSRLHSARARIRDALAEEEVLDG